MPSGADRRNLIGDRTDALETMLRWARRDRLVAPQGQPFAFVTHRGKVRKDNQDTALVLAGRRLNRADIFTAAVLCDGMGGLSQGDEAADLAAARAGAILGNDERCSPIERMTNAIRAANSAVFERFGGRAGTVIVAALIDEGEAVLGWLGDARVYGLVPGNDPKLLTRDDTIANEVARIEGAAPDAMDALLRAVGLKDHVEPHVCTVEPGLSALLLVSDGVHRIEPFALNWVYRHNAQSFVDLVERLRLAASCEGGIDNATALVVDLHKSPLLETDGPNLGAWVEAQPRIWEMVMETEDVGPAPAVSQSPPMPLAPAVAPQAPTYTTAKSRGKYMKKTSERLDDSRHEPSRPRTDRPEQAPLGVEIGVISKDKP